MKKIIILFIVLVVCGCGKKSELKCTQSGLKFDEGKMDVTVIYNLDSQEYVVSSSKTEKRFYENEKDATKFYEDHKDYSTQISELEIEYLEAHSYKEKILAKTLKSAMEGQGYTCEYKK